MSTMTEQNKTVIRRFLEAWNNRQPEAFDELTAPDVVRHCQATPAIEVRSLDQRMPHRVDCSNVQTPTHRTSLGHSETEIENNALRLTRHNGFFARPEPVNGPKETGADPPNPPKCRHFCRTRKSRGNSQRNT